jgi:predicted nucleic acid-binding protein
MRIRFETDAYYLILNGIQKKIYQMMISRMHYKEIESIEDIREKLQIIHLLDFNGIEPKYDLKRAKERSENLILRSFGIADALHLAFAEQSADCLVTCDDKLIKRSKRTDIQIEVMNPVEFCIKEELK